MPLAASGEIQQQLQQARSLTETGQRQQASALLVSLADDFAKRSLSSADADIVAELAFFFSQIKAWRDAALWFKKATELAPEKAVYHYNLATMLRIVGDLKGAEQALDKALELNPGDGEAQHLRSSLRSQSDSHNHIAELKQQLQKTALEPKQQVHLHYALAKELEDLQRYAESFAVLKQGADLRRVHLNYDVRRDQAIMQKIAQVFSKQQLQQKAGSGYTSAEPIFILGMPRTGSTLIERMLGSHSQVSMAGELNNFSQAMMAQIRALGQPGNILEAIQLSAELDFTALGESYIHSTRPDTGHKAHFIDKLPLNFLYIGLIKLALPNAKIIHVQRDPMDTCYAIYKHLFTHAYPFSYKLDELGQYYQAYQQLMAHWQRVLPGSILELSYEQLVSKPQTALKSVLEYCNLDWQAECLHFDRNTDASTTGSAAQIRQRLYTSSVGKWRHYKQQLAELEKRLS
jgi:tetratricopeptide (TPR) repeat protein